jgi:hypothetical protein
MKVNGDSGGFLRIKPKVWNFTKGCNKFKCPEEFNVPLWER